MANWHKPLLISLSVMISLSGFTPALAANSMLIPRLGYTTSEPKRIYLDITTPDKYKHNEKERKSEEKAKKVSEKKASHAKDKTAEKKKDPPLSKDEKLKQTEYKNATRIRKQSEKYLEAQERKPVVGLFYLYDDKNNQMLLKDPSKIQAAPTTDVASHYVEFKEVPGEGLYDLAVRGSGHRSESPIRVSDTIFWDALKPVLQDIGKAHCPDDPNKFYIIQECSSLNVYPASQSQSGAGAQKSQLVQGGWYTRGQVYNGLVKDTVDIAKLTQYLLQTYSLSPQSYKYLELKGDEYFQSPYPDILDEANWGLQYLLTAQRSDGGFPQGILQSEHTIGNTYNFTEESSGATAYAVMALANGVKAFKTEDLSLAVRFMRAAQKGWDYLQAHRDNDPQSLLLASQALSTVSPDPEYTKAFEACKEQLKTISPETAILLGAIPKGMSIDAPKIDLMSARPSEILPLLAKTQENNRLAYQELTQWVTRLYGYERVEMYRDSSLQMAAAWMDPLQWFAIKTGDLATQMTNHLSQQGLVPGVTPKIDSDALKDLEKKDTEAKKRIQEGYDALSLSTFDKAYLVYGLALLNQKLPSLAEAQEKGKKKIKRPVQQERYPDPTGNPKSFYPKMI